MQRGIVAGIVVDPSGKTWFQRARIFADSRPFSMVQLKKIMEHTTHTVEETYVIAKGLVHDILKHRAEDEKQAVVVALYGELGSGKTTFAQKIASELGVSKTVISPTFIIERVYKINVGVFTHFIHIDAYRLENADELLHLGFKDIVSDHKNFIAIEWAEKVEELLPKDTIKIYFEHVSEGERQIVIKSKSKVQK